MWNYTLAKFEKFRVLFGALFSIDWSPYLGFTMLLLSSLDKTNKSGGEEERTLLYTPAEHAGKIR